MVWTHLTDYLKGSIHSLGRALNFQAGRSIEDPAAFERWKAELAAALSVRQFDSSNLVSLGRRAFPSDFRFWVRFILYFIFSNDNECFYFLFYCRLGKVF